MSSVSFTEKINLITSNELHSLVGINKNVQQQINELNLDNIANGNINKYIANEQYNGSITISSNLNVGTGLLFNKEISDKFSFIIGTAIININKPNQGFYNQVVRRDMRWNLFTKASYALNSDWIIQPSFQYSKQGKYQELMLGGLAQYIFSLY